MTPKEKAEELYNKFTFKGLNWYGTQDNIHDRPKECALIAVDEILKQFIGVFQSMFNAGIITSNFEDSDNYKYWQEVKQEIEKL